MSFRSILSVVAGLEQAAEPAIGLLVPGASPVLAAIHPLVKRVQAGMATAELNDPREGMGALKESVVVRDFAAAFDLVQPALAKKKKKASWDDAKLRAAIAAQAEAYNLFATAIDSIDIVDLP